MVRVEELPAGLRKLAALLHRGARRDSRSVALGAIRHSMGEAGRPGHQEQNRAPSRKVRRQLTRVTSGFAGSPGISRHLGAVATASFCQRDQKLLVWSFCLPRLTGHPLRQQRLGTSVRKPSISQMAVERPTEVVDGAGGAKIGSGGVRGGNPASNGGWPEFAGGFLGKLAENMGRFGEPPGNPTATRPFPARARRRS